ncbi:hypothetical protein NBRC116492_24820 [Aurantivibrio infirmus]
MKYGVRLEGKNFELVTENGVENFGFFTTRFLKAISPEEAEKKAIELIKFDKSLNGTLAENRKYEPTIHLIDYWKEPWWKRLGGRGYGFYPMDSENE